MAEDRAETIGVDLNVTIQSEKHEKIRDIIKEFQKFLEDIEDPEIQIKRSGVSYNNYKTFRNRSG